MAKAATDLAISQPNVSKAIADLEHTFGVRLLDRGSRGVDPTPYGLAVIKRATAMFDELQQSVKEVEFLADPTSGELRLGCSDFAAGVAGVAIERMSRRYPRITFEVVSAGAGELQRHLESRNIELFVATNQETPSEDDFVAEILYDDPLIAVADAQHPLARRRTIELAELVHQPWAMPLVNTISGRYVREVFHAHRLPLPTTIVSTYSSVLRHHLVGNAGFITVLPKPMFEIMAKGLSIKALAVNLPTPRRTVVLVVLKKRTLSSIAQLFIETLRDVSRSPVMARTRPRGLRAEHGSSARHFRRRFSRRSQARRRPQRLGSVRCSRAELPGKEHGLCPAMRAATGCPSRLIAIQRDIVRGGT